MSEHYARIHNVPVCCCGSSCAVDSLCGVDAEVLPLVINPPKRFVSS